MIPSRQYPPPKKGCKFWHIWGDRAPSGEGGPWSILSSDEKHIYMGRGQIIGLFEPQTMYGASCPLATPMGWRRRLIGAATSVSTLRGNGNLFYQITNLWKRCHLCLDADIFFLTTSVEFYATQFRANAMFVSNFQMRLVSSDLLLKISAFFFQLQSLCVTFKCTQGKKCLKQKDRSWACGCNVLFPVNWRDPHLLRRPFFGDWITGVMPSTVWPFSPCCPRMWASDDSFRSQILMRPRTRTSQPGKQGLLFMSPALFPNRGLPKCLFSLPCTFCTTRRRYASTITNTFRESQTFW